MTLTRLLVAASCLAATAGPAWLESHADDRARAALAACGATECPPVGAIDIDVRGLWISDVTRQVGARRVQAFGIRVAPGSGTVLVDVDRIEVTSAPVRNAETAPASSPASSRAPKPRARPIPGPRGIPIAIRVRDPIVLEGPRGIHAELDEVRVELDGHGGLAVAADADLSHRRIGTVRTHVDARARGDLSRWGVRAELGQTGPTLEAELSPQSQRATITTSAGGRATVTPTDDGEGFVAQLTHFDLGALRSLPGPWPGPAAVDISDAVVDGRIETTRRLDRVHLSAVRIDGVRVDHPKLARRPVELDGIVLDGDLGRTTQARFAQLWISRGDVTVHAEGSIAPARYDLALHLPPTDCQTLLHAVPAGMRHTLEGLELRGELEGRLQLSLDRARLEAARRQYHGEPGEIPPRPGELWIDLPFAESCEVTADPVALDLDGLPGPYRHRFVAAGRERTRVMAPGGEGFVSLSSARLVASAFVTLEDSRFYDHDGFDREQIGNAIWHNLLRGAVHRGASTISQQTARNLWLGVDRSVARKVQEALLTTRLESAVDKDRILELYINAIELGPGLFGVEAAAQHYFDKSAADLTVREAVFVAALAPAPARFAKRFGDGEVDDEWEAWLDRQIHRMYLARRISWWDRDDALRRRTQLKLR